MEKRKSDPRRRGLGAPSDFITEQFVPSEDYKTQQIARVQKLAAAGLNPEDVASMFFIPANLLSDAMPQGEKLKDETPEES